MTEEKRTGAARRGDWKTVEMPERRDTFVLGRYFSDREMEALRASISP